MTPRIERALDAVLFLIPFPFQRQTVRPLIVELIEAIIEAARA